MSRNGEACILFLAFAAAGLAGMAPSVSFGDSGEFIAAVASLSIAHAPGFPLFCLLGRALGGLIFWANWGYRVNVLSVLASAGALAVLWRALVQAGFSRLAAWSGALFLGCCPLWLHTGLQTEVFALNSLLAACALWIACRSAGSLFSPRPMAALGLCLGLGGGNHHMLIFIVPALLWEAWGRHPNASAAARGLARLAAFGALGLGVYLYLPIRARAFPLLDWGHPVDLPRFLHVLLRKDYGSFALTVDGPAGGRWASLWPQLARYLRAFYSNFGPAGSALAFLGLVSWKGAGTRPSWRLPVAWMLIAGPGFLWLGNPSFDVLTTGALGRFYLLSWMGAALLAAAGTECLERVWPPAARALLLVPCLLAAASSGEWFQREDLAAYDYGRNVLRSIPPRALLYIDGGDDTFYTLAYLQYAERLRSDVEPHDRGGLVFANPYGADFRRLSKERKEERRIEVEALASAGRDTFYSTLRDTIIPGVPLVPWGLLRRVSREGSRPRGGAALWEIYPRRFSAELAQAHYRYRAMVPFYAVMRATEDPSRALMLLRQASLEGPDVLWVPGAVSARAQRLGYLAAQRKDWAAAESAYRLAAQAQPREAGVWNNIGVSLERQSRWEEAEAAYLRAAELPGDPFGAYRNLGAFYWSRGRWEDCARMFERAAALKPGDADTRRFLQAARARVNR